MSRQTEHTQTKCRIYQGLQRTLGYLFLSGTEIHLKLDILACDPSNGVARTLQKLRTSKGDYWIFNCVPFQNEKFS